MRAAESLGESFGRTIKYLEQGRNDFTKSSRQVGGADYGATRFTLRPHPRGPHRARPPFWAGRKLAPATQGRGGRGSSHPLELASFIFKSGECSVVACQASWSPSWA